MALGLLFLGCSGNRDQAEKQATPQKIKKKAQSPRKNKLTRKVLQKSLALGRKYLLFNQQFEGNFNYNGNFITAQQSVEDGPVRQSGAFWGLSLIHQNEPTDETKQAVLKAYQFFHRNSRQREQRRWVVYPGQKTGQTGLVALVALGLIEYLRVEPNKQLQEHLDSYLNLLVSMRRKDGRFHAQFDPVTEKPIGTPSPYFDGEALLALTKAARYMKRADLQPLAIESARAMNQAYFGSHLKDGSDRDDTKGFYQWGSMAFFELSDAKWEKTEWCKEAVIDAAIWMIDTHKTLQRKRNTGYAYEGIVLAHELCRRHKRSARTKKLATVIDQGMSRLVSWQVGGPTPNAFLKKNKTDDPQWVGGIMNAADDPWLRIDVTQHQMHATILALRWVYK